MRRLAVAVGLRNSPEIAPSVIPIVELLACASSCRVTKPPWRFVAVLARESAIIEAARRTVVTVAFDGMCVLWAGAVTTL
jgi:hypothetical protein